MWQKKQLEQRLLCCLVQGTTPTLFSVEHSRPRTWQLKVGPIPTHQPTNQPTNHASKFWRQDLSPSLTDVASLAYEHSLYTPDADFLRPIVAPANKKE